jgi:hypothetical protein
MVKFEGVMVGGRKGDEERREKTKEVSQSWRI